MNYREEVLRTAGAKSGRDGFILVGLGIAGEAGEVTDLIKKHTMHSHPLDREKLIKELGDVRWYLELCAYLLGVSMEEVERENIEKLKKRYPNGFSPEASLNRADK